MFKEVLRPFFILWFLCMFLTAAAELAPGQWVDMALTRTVGMKGIWLLVYVSGLMFVMRHFAGPLAHKLSPVGLLWISCLLASIGLLLLSVANSKITGLLAATVWGDRRLLHVADHAGGRLGTISARRRVADGIDGHRRNAYRSISSFRRWDNFRQRENPGRGRGRSVQGAYRATSSTKC